MRYVHNNSLLALKILGITLLISFSCSAQKNTTHPITEYI